MSQYERSLDAKRRQRIAAADQAARYRQTESSKRAEAADARARAERTKSGATQGSRLRQAADADKAAARAGRNAGEWEKRAARYQREEGSLEEKVTRAQRAQAQAADRARRLVQQQAAQALADVNQRVGETEILVADVVRELRAPKQEKLRVLLLGAASDGGLRIGREQQRIENAVRNANHRDAIEIRSRPAATTADLFDGITQFKPHVIHFSGHSDHDAIEFEHDRDEPHDQGAIVTARAFAESIAAPDDPPLLVLLNSCNSASQIDDLIEKTSIEFAIGMADEIDDGDAITYAAQFYAAVADGQSIGAANALGRARLKADGLEGADLPTLAHRDDVDPNATYLVTPLPAT